MEKQVNIPKLRFPEFKEIWTTKPLIDLSENGFSNGAFNDPKKVGSGYRIINVKDMYVDGTINVENLTRVALDENEFQKNRVEYGDLFFTRSSLVKEGIAYSNINLNRFDDLTFDGHLIRMRPNHKNTSPVYLYYCFSTSGARKQFIQKGKTTTMTTIGQDDIATVEIPIPTLPEQTKIANFLTAVDDKLTHLKKKKNLLEQYKKGVMQKLFSQDLRFMNENGEDFAEWEEKKLGDCLYIQGGYAFKSEKFNSGNTKVMRIGDIVPNISIQNFSGILSTEIPNEKFTVKKGDFLMALSGATFGKVGKIKDEGLAYINQRVATFITSQCLEYFYQLVQSTEFKNYLNSIPSASAQPNISNDDIGKYETSIPSIPEQTKIANFLSAIDDKINNCGVQIEKMEGWKKGLLQGMFV